MKKTYSEEHTYERKLIFANNAFGICVKEFLDVRFNDDKEEIFAFSDGRVLKPSIHWTYIESMMSVLKKEQLYGYYEMFVDEEGRTIEVIEIERDRIAFSSNKTPVEIMKNKSLRHLLKIAAFEKAKKTGEIESLNKWLCQNDYRVINRKIYTKQNSSYSIISYNGYYVVQEPIMCLEPSRRNETNIAMNNLIKDYLNNRKELEKAD